MGIITQQSAARGALENMQKDKQGKEEEYQKELVFITLYLVLTCVHLTYSIVNFNMYSAYTGLYFYQTYIGLIKSLV